MDSFITNLKIKTQRIPFILIKLFKIREIYFFTKEYSVNHSFKSSLGISSVNESILVDQLPVVLKTLFQIF